METIEVDRHDGVVTITLNRPTKKNAATVQLWTELLATQGIDGRDSIWEHAELLPTAEDLDDPSGFAARSTLDLSELEQAPAPPADPEAPGSGA